MFSPFETILAFEIKEFMNLFCAIFNLSNLLKTKS